MYQVSSTGSASHHPRRNSLLIVAMRSKQRNACLLQVQSDVGLYALKDPSPRIYFCAQVSEHVEMQHVEIQKEESNLNIHLGTDHTDWAGSQ